MKRIACALHEEERALHSSNLSFMYLNVGEVHSGTLAGEPSFFRPTTNEFAKSVVKSLGCGRRVVVPWHLHNILTVILDFVPESLLRYSAQLKLNKLAKEFSF